MPKPEKITVVDKVKKYLEESNAFFITDYTGLNVEDITLLRKNLREHSVKYLVAKNTLMRIAAKDAGFENIIEFLSGQTAIAFGVDDPAVPAKILYDSFKDIEKPVINSREVLLARLIGAIESPIQSTLGSIDGLMQELVATVDALAKAKG